MIAPLPLKSLLVYCGQRVMTVRLGWLCTLLTSVGERNKLGKSPLEQLREAMIKTPMRNQERFQGFSRH